MSGRVTETWRDALSRYADPKHCLNAARSLATSAEELASLARSDMDFVRNAVAGNPSASVDTLRSLAPTPITSWSDQEIALSLACNPLSPVDLLVRLLQSLAPLLNGGRDGRVAFDAARILCANPVVPLEHISALFSAPGVATRFRKVLARDSTRADVVALLLTDRSAVVRRRASQNPLASTASPRAAPPPTPVLPSPA